MIDFAHQVNAVARSVGSRTLEAGEARTVVVSQVFDAELGDVFDACSNPDRLPRWFLPVTGDLEVGGRYQLEGNAGGEVLRCEPPHGYLITWEYGEEISWVELALTEETTGQTTFTLTHIARVDNDRWAQFGPGAVGVGWDLALTGLRTHLETGESVDPVAAAAWSTSPEGQEFITGSSRRWADASIAFGTDPEGAQKAAAATTAFYTGS